MVRVRVCDIGQVGQTGFSMSEKAEFPKSQRNPGIDGAPTVTSSRQHPLHAKECVPTSNPTMAWIYDVPTDDNLLDYSMCTMLDLYVL